MENYCRFAFPLSAHSRLLSVFYRLLIDSICHRGKLSLFPLHLQILINEETTRLSNALRASVYVRVWTISIFFRNPQKFEVHQREMRSFPPPKRFPRASRSRSSGKKCLPCGSAEKNYSRAVTRSSVNKLILPGQGCFAFFSLFPSLTLAKRRYHQLWNRMLEKVGKYFRSFVVKFSLRFRSGRWRKFQSLFFSLCASFRTQLKQQHHHQSCRFFSPVEALSSQSWHENRFMGKVASSFKLFFCFWKVAQNWFSQSLLIRDSSPFSENPLSLHVSSSDFINSQSIRFESGAEAEILCCWRKKKRKIWGSEWPKFEMKTLCSLEWSAMYISIPTPVPLNSSSSFSPSPPALPIQLQRRCSSSFFFEGKKNRSPESNEAFYSVCHATRAFI